MNSEEFIKLFNQTVAKAKIKVDYEYRLYYNKETGEPLFYSMEGHPEGSFIVVTKEQYAEGRHDLNIRKGVIERLIDSVNWTKLVPSNEEGTSTRADNVMIVDDNGAAKWKLKTYYSD
tara:strand:+ start:483 stop:836 length:354 start_codon:yes stop_codon:yes gene_type:complete